MQRLSSPAVSDLGEHYLRLDGQAPQAWIGYESAQGQDEAVKARRNRPDSASRIKTNRGGRPQSNCCLTREGQVVPDEKI